MKHIEIGIDPLLQEVMLRLAHFTTKTTVSYEEWIRNGPFASDLPLLRLLVLESARWLEGKAHISMSDEGAFLRYTMDICEEMAPVVNAAIRSILIKSTITRWMEACGNLSKASIWSTGSETAADNLIGLLRKSSPPFRRPYTII